MSRPVKFYLDEHVHPAIAAGLRRRDVDVLTTKEAGMLTATDIEHLTFAAREQRVIFTQDDDFLRLHASGQTHAGIVYARQRTAVGHIIRGLMLIHQVLTAEEMQNHVEFL
jgi:predicted nuclease of predicted toxin-antitoxin system